MKIFVEIDPDDYTVRVFSTFEDMYAALASYANDTYLDYSRLIPSTMTNVKTTVEEDGFVFLYTPNGDDWIIKYQVVEI